MESQIHHVQEPIVLSKHQQGIALCLIVCVKRMKEKQYGWICPNKVCSVAGFAQSAVQYMAQAFLPAGIASRGWKSLVHTKEAVSWTE